LPDVTTKNNNRSSCKLHPDIKQTNYILHMPS
jgi:hypothetical protein